MYYSCISDNDDETDQSGSSIEVKSEDNKLLDEKPKIVVSILIIFSLNHFNDF